MMVGERAALTDDSWVAEWVVSTAGLWAVSTVVVKAAAMVAYLDELTGDV